MQRLILRADETAEYAEVGDGWQEWNSTLNISMGEIIDIPGGVGMLWCDEEGRCRRQPQHNAAASILAGQQIVGDVIVLKPEDIK